MAFRLDRLLDRQASLPPSVPVLSPLLPRLHGNDGAKEGGQNEMSERERE
jgi:hypothetical protein